MFEQLKDTISHLSTWKCEIVCTGFTIFESSHLQDVDICQFIAPIRNHPSGTVPKFSDLSSWNGSQFQFDPSQFKGIECRQAIKNYLIDACKNAGFKVDPNIKLKKYTEKNKKPPSKSCEIIFKCSHNRKSIVEMAMKRNSKEDADKSKYNDKRHDKTSRRYVIT